MDDVLQQNNISLVDPKFKELVVFYLKSSPQVK